MISTITLHSLQAMARRHSRVADEADDLVQDLLLRMLESGRSGQEPGFLAWAHGALRNHARFVARGAARRRRREASSGSVLQDRPFTRRIHADQLAQLPRALRVVAVCVNAGLNRQEIAYLLALNGTALRQRLSGLKRVLAVVAPHPDAEVAEAARPADGPLRRALQRDLPALAVRRLAVRDPDGHALFFWERDHVRTALGNLRHEPPKGPLDDP